MSACQLYRNLECIGDSKVSCVENNSACRSVECDVTMQAKMQVALIEGHVALKNCAMQQPNLVVGGDLMMGVVVPYCEEPGVVWRQWAECRSIVEETKEIDVSATFVRSIFL